MRVPRGGLLLLLFAQPPAPGLHLAFPSKANFLPSRSVHSLRLGCCKSLPGHQLGTLSRQPSQCGKFSYLLARGWEVPEVGPSEKRSVECLSTSAEAVQSAKGETDADERRRKKWIADREAEQAEVQRGKRIWLGDGKLVYSSKVTGSREESSRPRGDNGGPRYEDTLSDSAGEPREIAGSRGRGTGAGGVRGRGGGRGAGRGRGIGRGRGEFSGAAAAEVRSSRNFVRQEPTYSEGVIERSSEASASDSPRDLSTSGRTSRGTFGRGGSGRGGYGRGQENESESSYGGYSRGGFSRGGFSRGRGGSTRGGLGRGESGRGGFSRGGFSRGGFSRGGFSRGGLSRGGPGRGGYSRGETSRNDENESDIDNGSTDASEEGLGRPGSTRGGTRGSYGRGGLSRGGSSRGGFTRGSSTRGGLSRGRGYGRGELTSRSDRDTDDGSNDGSDGGFSRGRAASGRGSFRGSSSRGGYGRGNFNSGRDSETSTAGSDQFEGRPGEFSRERGGFSRGRGGISRGRGGFSRGRGSSSGGGYSRETSSGLDNDNLGRDNRRTERFEGGRGGIGRGRGSFRGRDQRPQDRLGTEVSLASGKYAQQAADESDDSDEELPVTKTFSGREDAVSLFEKDSDVSEAEDNEGITAGDRDHLDRGKSDVLGKQSSEALGTEAGNTGSGGAIQANEVDDLPAGTQRLQREAGEENWQFMVRKKRADTQKESENVGLEVENGVTEYQSEAYKQRKVAWLCKEIPFLGPRDTVSILNAQKRWITAAEAKQVIKHLMEIDHSIRAYRVHRWMVDQGWYEFDFKLQTELANLLCQLDTTRRARELFDQIINSRNVPDSSTYVALINKYIEEKVVPSIEEAWSLFNQMQQLGGYERPASLQHALFDALLQKTQVTPVFAERADMLFEIMKETGTERTREMFESLMTYHARKGNSTRVAALSEEMILEGIEVGSNVFSKMVDASAEEGSPEKAEKAFKDLLEAGYMADVSVYISLMTAYGKAGRYAEALEKFEAMEGAGIKANARAFDIITSLMAYSGQQADAEALLQRMESSGRVPSLLTYNALIEMYGKKGLSDEAEKVFKQMLAHDRLPNKSTYVSLIEHYVQKGSLEDAEAMYEEMRDKVAVAHKAYCLMLEAYGKAGQKDKLKEIFEHPTSRRFSIPDDCKKYLLGVVSRKDIEGRAETKVTLQKSQRKALMGVLLGGARVETHDKDRTYEVHFELDPEGPGSSTVIDHLYQTFSEWAAAPPEIIASQADKESQQSSTRRGFATVSHGSFRFFSHQFRSEGKPIIPRLIHRWLGPECLAYWYMYGGQRCDETGGIILHVANYSQKEIILVRKALQQISLDSDVKERGGKRILQLEGQSAQWMWKLIEPHVVEELKDVFRPFSKPETDQANGSSILDTGPRASESPSRTIANGVGKSSAELPMAEAVQAM